MKDIRAMTILIGRDVWDRNKWKSIVEQANTRLVL
jgi:hypothetical protein